MSDITLVRQPDAGRPTATRVRELLHYEPGTGVFCWLVDRAHNAKAGAVAGTKSLKGYWIISVDGKQYYAHHLAWLIVTGEWPTEIDHKNTDALDNSWGNLRIGDDNLNARNKRRALSTNKSSGVLGVSRSVKSTTHPWKAQIRVDGQIRYLGSFETIEAASAAYLAAKMTHHGVGP